MKIDFVTQQIALKLKEKGFPQVKDNTLAMYNENGEWFSLASTLDKDEYSFEDFDDRDCVCPTIAQVLKWLRENKRLEANGCYDNDGEGWMGYVCEMDVPDLYAFHTLKERHKLYEEAALSAIEYILNNNLI
jgi:hypothetical protein